MRVRANKANSRLPRPALSHTVAAIRAAFAASDIAPARPDEVAEAQAFAARLIGGKNVAPETLARIHERTGAALFLIREQDEITCVYAMVLLTEAGRRAAWADRFDSLNPSPRHVCAGHDEPAAIYGWGIAATNHGAAQRMLDACGVLGQSAAPHLPVFARPVTPAGLRLMMERLRFKPVPGSTSGLVWTEPFASLQAAAA